LNDNHVEQLVTRSNNILDLLFCTCPAFISNLQIVPEISDHEVITFNYNYDCCLPLDAPDHCIPLYHKADVNKLKLPCLTFKSNSLTDPLIAKALKPTGQDLRKQYLMLQMNSIPKKTCKSKNHLPWITHSILAKDE